MKKYQSNKNGGKADMTRIINRLMTGRKKCDLIEQRKRTYNVNRHGSD